MTDANATQTTPPKQTDKNKDKESKFKPTPSLTVSPTDPNYAAACLKARRAQLEATGKDISAEEKAMIEQEIKRLEDLHGDKG